MTEITHPHACQGLDHDLSRRQALGILTGGATGVGLGGLLDPTIAA